MQLNIPPLKNSHSPKSGMQPKKGKKREPSGRIKKIEREKKEEPPEVVLALARWQRAKLGATDGNFDKPEWGHPLGRMRLWASQTRDDSLGLSQVQYNAIDGYLSRRARARALQGFPPDSPQSPMIGDFTRSGGEEMDDEAILEARREHNIDRKILLADKRGASWIALLGALARQEGGHYFWKSAIGEIRTIANVLANARRKK